MGDFEERLKENDIQGSSLEENSAPEPGNFEIEKSKNSGLKKIVFFAGGVLMFLVIIMVFITSGIFGPDRISEKQLIVGAALTMEENKSLKIEMGEEEHEIEVQNVGEDWAEIVVRSDPLKFVLKVNEVIELDLDNDGQSDIRVKLFKIQEGNAVIAVKKIDKQACVEDWNCQGWGGCVAGKRERNCEDKNDCGSEFFIPLHEQKCIGDNPVEVNDTPKKVKGMGDVMGIEKIEFSDNVKIKSNVQENESDDEINNASLSEDEEEEEEGDLNEENEMVDEDNSSKNISIEMIDDSEGNGSYLNDSNSPSNVGFAPIS